jgi:fucose 4-O-acetylase-like acetyltransferase
VNICECAYGNPFYYFIAAFAGVFWLLDAARLLKNIKWLCWLGKNSLPIFGIHSFVLWCFVKLYCFTVGEEMKKLPDNIWAFLIPVAVYACCIPFAPVWNKVKEYVLKNIKA